MSKFDGGSGRKPEKIIIVDKAEKVIKRKY